MRKKSFSHYIYFISINFITFWNIYIKPARNKWRSTRLKNSDILLQLARFRMWPNLNVQAQKIKHRTLNEFFPRTTHIKIYCAWGVNRWYNTTFCVGLYCLSSELVCTASIIKTDITKHRTTLIPFLARWVKVWAFIMNDVCDIRLSLLFNLVK